MNDPLIAATNHSMDAMHTIRILFLEDNADDVELMQFELTEANVNYLAKHVDKKKEFLPQLAAFHPDIILADYSLSSFNGMQAFRMLREAGLKIPFILVTGVLSEDLALECLKEGVDDFILKSSFKRLPAAIVNAINKKDAENEKDRMAEELRKSHEELRSLLKQQQIAREDERLNIARDLHDELGQMLTALKIDLTMFKKKLKTRKGPEEEGDEQELVGITRLVDRISQSVRRIASGLRPLILDELGMIEAIRWQCKEFEARSKIICNANLPADSIEIDREFAIAIFRIVQETLTNVARHALATKVNVQLNLKDNSLRLKIEDNGRGISDEEAMSSRSLGLIGLRERVRFLNGTFSIHGEPNKGTTVQVSVPMQQQHQLVAHD